MVRFLRMVLSVGFSLLTLGCSAGNLGSQEPPTKDDISVTETDSESVTIEEPISIYNCNGTGTIIHSTERSQTESYEMSTSVEVGAGVISAALEVSYSQFKGVVKSLQLPAAAGTNMTYTVRWTERTYIGTILEKGSVVLGSYRYQVPFSVEVIPGSDLDIGCQTNSVGNGAEGLETRVTPASNASTLNRYEWMSGDILGESGICRFAVSGPNQELGIDPVGLTASGYFYAATQEEFELQKNSLQQRAIDDSSNPSGRCDEI